MPPRTSAARPLRGTGRLRSLPRRSPAGSFPAAWVDRLGTAAWVSDGHGVVIHMNPGAERLLGLSTEDCAGLPCHRVVAGTDRAGTALCQGRCTVRDRATAGLPVEPRDVVLPGPRGEGLTARLTVIPLDAPDGGGPWLLHLAEDVDGTRRAERYLERVAARSADLRRTDPAPETPPLTPREREILDLLAEDLDVPQIAQRLGIAAVTARNHVQRILPKLGAHSVQEAVAIHLLG